MEYASIQLNDLPDEILLIIFKNVNNVGLLYSLFGLNKRFNKILHDPIFTNHLNLLKFCSNNSIDQLPSPILDRFCLQILPEIHDKIKSLNLESFSMERILLTRNYPNLSGLGLYNIKLVTAIYLLSGATHLTHIFKNQISSLAIDVIKDRKENLTQDVYKFIFTNIFITFSKLKYLKFCPSSFLYQEFSFDSSPPIVFSSTLLELHINLEHFTDCLYVLDGRFNQLRTFCVNISFITSSNLLINNQEKLPNLRCFSLHCNMSTDGYDELVLPLLQRMLNLEKLDLYLIICGKKTFIDGNDLKKILNNMSRLNKFLFNITSNIDFNNEIDLPSNEDIQHTFKDFKDNKIIYCVDYFPKKKEGQCHIYSYPYGLKVYNNITNNFPGGFFQYVQEVSLFDERPFEYEFFLRISQSFPFIKKIKLTNCMPQNDKQFRKSKNVNQDLSVIGYPHLIRLDLTGAHDDYAEQFLTDNKVCLPNNVFLIIDYRSLHEVTHNFTKDTTRINCAKLDSIFFSNKFACPQHLKDDFPKRLKNYCPNTKTF